ncbi:DUF6153 family protein [Pseudarthrobacter sp. J1738]|uniref:DUF6153 family protein n=1 Tax=Pseudarthrobacter sp. J1738 TaxID=3420446 RepID=UPI003D2DC7CA
MRTVFKHPSLLPSSNAVPGLILAFLVLAGLLLGILGMHAPTTGHGASAPHHTTSHTPGGFAAAAVAPSGGWVTPAVAHPNEISLPAGNQSWGCLEQCTMTAQHRACAPQSGATVPLPVLPAMEPAANRPAIMSASGVPCPVPAGHGRAAPSLTELSISRT